MKNFCRFALVFLTISWMAGFAMAQPLPPCYHRLNQLYDFIFQLDATDTNNYVHIDTIGHSRGDMLGVQYPIYAVKISDTADVFEDEPVMLVVCHIHAEEVIGIELCADYMTRLVSGQYNSLIAATQIYFIPTMNPDGLQVISYGVPSGGDTLWDNTWRKNGYKPPQMGEANCNVAPGSGGDSCGVDLNRNFDINWIYGDTIWKPSGTELYDYYRGPAPFSEPEDQCVRDFARQIHPALSIVYHSSRSGRIAEQGIVAWQWGYDAGPYKFPPDSAAIWNINDPYCGLLPKFSDQGTYTRVFGGTHNGCLQDWFYQQLGCIQILTELGPGVNIQPACTTLTNLITNDRPSLNWMQRRLINRSFNGDMDNEAAVLNIYTRDATTQSAISAEWRNLNTWSPVLGKWTTNEEFGRATFFPPLGQCTIQVRKEGYVTRDTTVTIPTGANSARTVPLYLQPLPWHALSLIIRDGNGNPVPGRVYVDGEFPKWLVVPSGGLTTNLPQGTFRIMFVPDDGGLAVLWRDIDLSGDATLDVWCPSVTAIPIDNFENGLGNWTSGGDGNNWRLDPDTTTFMYGQSLCTTPNSGPVWPYVYSNNCSTWIWLDTTLNSDSGNVCILQFDRRGRMDVPADSFFVETSLDGQSWQKAAGFCDMEVPWTRTYVDLNSLAGVNFQLRFRLQSDAALGEVGMHIDNLTLLGALDTSADEPPVPIPYSYRIVSAYPNPFNPSTTISYEVAAAGRVSFDVYNIAGQRVRHYDVNAPAAGAYHLIWDGANDAGTALSSGLHFVQLQARGHSATQKLLLLR